MAGIGQKYSKRTQSMLCPIVSKLQFKLKCKFLELNHPLESFHSVEMP